MTRGKKEREREKRKREKEITRLFETNYGYFAGVRRRWTNGWRTPRGCILRLVNGGGRPRGGREWFRPPPAESIPPQCSAIAAHVHTYHGLSASIML